MTEGLRQSIGLIRRNVGVLLHPPGASPYIALMLAIAGLEVGLNAPYAIAETLAVRTLARDGVGAFMAAVQGMPEPSRPALASALILLALCLFTLGGWINTAYALAQGRSPRAADWHAGILHSGRAIFWIGVVATGVLAVVGGTGTLVAGTVRAWLSGTLGAGWAGLAWPMASGAAFMLALVSGLYVLGASVIMGVVAVVEPETRFLRIPMRSRAIFKAAEGGNYLTKMGALLVGWLMVKLALMQLAIPLEPVPAPLGRLISIAGSVLHGALMFGDGLVALVGIVLAVLMYRRGSLRLAT